MGNRFIVTCNAEGHIKVWDLETVLAGSISKDSENGLLIHYIEPKLRSCGEEDEKVTHKMQADEYQIAFIIQTETAKDSDNDSLDPMFGMGDDEQSSDLIYVMDFSEDCDIELLKLMLEASPKTGPLRLPKTM